MAGVVSLGVYRPAALDYLIEERILPADPDKSTYHCQVYLGKEHGIQEEIFRTSNCVVWSRNGFIQKVFRFNEPGQKVHEAVLSNFRTPQDAPEGPLLPETSTVSPTSKRRPLLAQAIAIILDKEIQIHFLTGSSQVTNLLFDVEEVFAAPEGLLLQRRRPVDQEASKSPVLPSAPPNSFYLSQPLHATSVPSPLAGKHGVVTGMYTSGRPKSTKLEALLDAAYESPVADSGDQIPRLYTLLGPQSEPQPLLQASMITRARQGRHGEASLVVQYDELDSYETCLYLSSADELTGAETEGSGTPLILLVTANQDLGQVTLWQGWFVKTQKLSELVAQRKEVKASRARRRSSFVTAPEMNGIVTPAHRHHDRGRESYAASTRLLAGNVRPAKQGKRTSKSIIKDDEELLASQLDPDSQTGTWDGIARRRVSSRLSRADLATADPARGHIGANAALTGQPRRGTSFGTAHDRRSLGNGNLRTSRGSTPGSSFSKSVMLEDEEMDIDGDDPTTDRQKLAETVRLFEATQVHTFASSVIGPSADSVVPELVLRKLDSMPLPATTNRTSTSTADLRFSFKITTLLKPAKEREKASQLSLYLLNKITEELATIDMRVARAAGERPNSSLHTSSLPVPIITRVSTRSACLDLAKVQQIDSTALCIRTASDTITIATDTGSRWSVPLPAKLRYHGPTDIRQSLDQRIRDIGRNRTIDTPSNFRLLGDVDRHGSLILTTPEGAQHQMKVRLRPECSMVARLLRVCQYVLDPENVPIVPLWAALSEVMHSQHLSSKDSKIAEWEVMIVTMFSFAVGSIGRSSTSRSHHQRNSASHRLSSDFKLELRKHATDRSRSQNDTAWGWLQDGKPRNPACPTLSPPNRTKAASSSKGDATAMFKTSMIEYEAIARHSLHEIAHGELAWLRSPAHDEVRYRCCLRILMAFHLCREEQKLSSLLNSTANIGSALLLPALAQLGGWLSMEAWSWSEHDYYSSEGRLDLWTFSESKLKGAPSESKLLASAPPSILQWLERALSEEQVDAFANLEQVRSLGMDRDMLAPAPAIEAEVLPRMTYVQRLLSCLRHPAYTTHLTLEKLQASGLSIQIMESLPEAVAAPLREEIAKSQHDPSSTWTGDLLKLVGREDLVTTDRASPHAAGRGRHGAQLGTMTAPTLSNAFAVAEKGPLIAKTHEADRHAIIALIFNEDRRFVDASRLTNPALQQLAECLPQPEWSDNELFEQEKRIAQHALTRTISMYPGTALVRYESQHPLLSEKFHISGFNLNYLMKPTERPVTVDRSGFTEDKFSWAFFHAGVAAGLQISRHAKGIDTSWIVFNKPAELSNRHAGFLLALGINGHLRSLAKWLAFKYLTPKHTMTSVGLLLGLSASYLGSMDSLVTRMLSVHITRMLPVGAAELNVSSTTQTAGLMGIGLLYYNTQHRRMSEIMISELENRQSDDSGSASEDLRTESYRLAAGLALGFINIGQGRDLQGLHGMELLKRLLAVAVGPRPVDIVHVVDKSVAGAVLAIALMYLKSEDRTVARKVDIPETIAQLDHIRPDILLLRILSKQLIMWSEISVGPDWLRRQLPGELARRYFLNKPASTRNLSKMVDLSSDDVPFFNIMTGLLWSIALKHAGSGNTLARDDILSWLELFTTLNGKHALYYDAQLARATVRRCIDVLALAAATIMAGTGDLTTYRYLRRLHGRTDGNTSYGSHIAAHLAIGALFLGGGTYTFGTSNLAIAALVTAFYPLFPSEVLDNGVHMQALRHLWVLAAEARCIVVRDIDTGRPMRMAVRLQLFDGSEKQITAPSLLPELETIASITTDDPAYWQVRLDFAANPKHLESFRRDQTIYVRSAPAHLAATSPFSAALTAMNDQLKISSGRQLWEWILRRPAFHDFDEADLGLVLPSNAQSTVNVQGDGTVLDDRLVLIKSNHSENKDALWNLRLLLRWAEVARASDDGRLRWLGGSVIDELSTRIQARTTGGTTQPE